MSFRLLSLTALATLALTAPSLAGVQATPAPSPSAAPTEQATAAPSPSASPAPKATMAPRTSSHKRSVKHIPEAKLSYDQVLYAVTHPAQEAAKLRAMHGVSFSSLRVYHLTPALRAKLKAHAHTGYVAFDPFSMPDALAQTSTNPLLDILANINIQNALNNTLNGNNVSVSLSNVLNSNNIAIGQVLGVYVGGAGIITTII